MKNITPAPLGKVKTVINFHLGSGSKLKLGALQDALNELGICGQVYSVKEAKSGVNEQPVGEEEILRGAINRAISAYSLNSNGEVYIAIENGIEQDESGSWLDYAIVLAFAPAYKTITYVKSQAAAFPSKQVEKTANKSGGFKLNTVGKTLQEDGVVKLHDDPHLDLVGVSRRHILKDALKELVKKLCKEVLLRKLNQ